jgi:hypothetical protein
VWVSDLKSFSVTKRPSRHAGRLSRERPRILHDFRLRKPSANLVRYVVNVGWDGTQSRLGCEDAAKKLKAAVL